MEAYEVEVTAVMVEATAVAWEAVEKEAEERERRGEWHQVQEPRVVMQWSGSDLLHCPK